MTPDQLQKALKLCYAALGLASEAGEVAGKIKKMIRDDKGVMTDARKDATLKEVGETLWYAAEVATQLGASLGQVAAGNLSILADRKARGTLTGDGDDR